MRSILWKAVVAFVVCTAMTCCSWADEEENASTQDKLKAVFIYHFTKYVEWPDDGTNTFDITVFGDSRITKPLRKIAAKQKVKKRNIRVKKVDDVQEIEQCHILFISESKEEKLKDILKKAESLKILTIGSSDGLAKKGVAINFIIIKGRMKFEINTDAMARIELKLSSQLLKLAKIVREQDRSE